MARITNAIQEVATDLKANLPRLFQESRELRRETQQLTIAYNSAAMEMLCGPEMLESPSRSMAAPWHAMWERRTRRQGGL